MQIWSLTSTGSAVQSLGVQISCDHDLWPGNNKKYCNCCWKRRGLFSINVFSLRFVSTSRLQTTGPSIWVPQYRETFILHILLWKYRNISSCSVFSVSVKVKMCWSFRLIPRHHFILTALLCRVVFIFFSVSYLSVCLDWFPVPELQDGEIYSPHLSYSCFIFLFLWDTWEHPPLFLNLCIIISVTDSYFMVWNCARYGKKIKHPAGWQSYRSDWNDAPSDWFTCTFSF